MRFFPFFEDAKFRQSLQSKTLNGLALDSRKMLRQQSLAQIAMRPLNRFENRYDQVIGWLGLAGQESDGAWSGGGWSGGGWSCSNSRWQNGGW